jgi:anti-sigma regulatory factor (Ser/Thr protein kinase)
MASASWTIRPSAEAVSEIRYATVSFAREHGVAGSPLAGLQLAVSEAVTNAVVHAFRDAEKPGTVMVSISVVPREEVEVTVCDDGGGLAPRDDSPGLGLGLALIERVADHMEVRPPRSGVGTELWMRFGIRGT